MLDVVDGHTYVQLTEPRVTHTLDSGMMRGALLMQQCTNNEGAANACGQATTGSLPKTYVGVVLGRWCWSNEDLRSGVLGTLAQVASPVRARSTINVGCDMAVERK
jgi:hypothetical protein